MPVAVETTGVWGKQGLSFIHDIGRKIRDSTGEPRSTSYLIQRISLAVQRGNAASILGATPKQTGLEEVFYILSDPKCTSNCNTTNNNQCNTVIL